MTFRVGHILKRLFSSCASTEEIRQYAGRVCRECLKGEWSTVPDDQLIVRKISGGLSNFLYYVSLPKNESSNNNEYAGVTDGTSPIANQTTQHGAPSGSKFSSGNTFRLIDQNQNIASHQNHMANEVPNEVLLRIYGDTKGENAVEAMITESVVFAVLSERNFGPKLYGLFPGGRIEQFFHARPLLTRELRIEDISLKIAEKMGEIHRLSIPMSKEPDWLWNHIDRWMKRIERVLESFIPEKETDAEFVCTFDLQKEIEWLQSLVSKQQYKVLFCHNDMQEGNILLQENEASQNDDKNSNVKLVIIDFEYCGYNYRGFDLANHFIEWTFDYSIREHPFYKHTKHVYPSKKERERFIVAYLKKLNEHQSKYVPTEVEVLLVEKEVQVFSLFSHFFWSLWSIANIESQIEFGYWEYAATRLKEFSILKQQFQ